MQRESVGSRFTCEEMTYAIQGSKRHFIDNDSAPSGSSLLGPTQTTRKTMKRGGFTRYQWRCRRNALRERSVVVCGETAQATEL